MEKIRFNFQCTIIRKTIDGFSALSSDTYLIKFRDSKYHYFFEEGDVLDITIENTDKNSNDEVKEKYAIIYVVLHGFMSNGITFRDIGVRASFFWSIRGMITHQKWERDNIFEENEVLKIIIKKLE